MPTLWAASGIIETPFGHILRQWAKINCSLLDGVNSYGTYRGRDILHVTRQSKVNFSNENHDSPTEKFCAAVEVWVILSRPQFNRN